MAILHYEGELGVFDYDDKEFQVSPYPDNEYLKYIGHETDGLKIEIPNGIKDCRHMFNRCESLKTPPVIPDGVTSCNCMFSQCSSLEKPPVIPKSVKNCIAMFAYCDFLKTPPVIPEGVKDCNAMFQGCKNLRQAPEIPKSVTNCRYMLANCKNLNTAPVIPENVEDCFCMFDNCSIPVIAEAMWNMEHRGYNMQSFGQEQEAIDKLLTEHENAINTYLTSYEDSSPAVLKEAYSALDDIATAFGKSEYSADKILNRLEMVLDEKLPDDGKKQLIKAINACKEHDLLINEKSLSKRADNDLVH